MAPSSHGGFPISHYRAGACVHQIRPRQLNQALGTTESGLCHDRERLNRYPLAGAAHFRHRSGSSAPLRTTSIFPWRQASLEESRCRSFTRTSAFGAAYGLSSSITVAPPTCGTPEKRIANLDMNDSELSMPLLGIQEPLRDRSIRVDPAVAEERPVAAGFFLKPGIAIGDDDLLGVLAGLGDDPAERIGQE